MPRLFSCCLLVSIIFVGKFVSPYRSVDRSDEIVKDFYRLSVMSVYFRFFVNNDLPRCLRVFCQIRLCPYHKVRTKPPSSKIIENSGVLVASKYCGKFALTDNVICANGQEKLKYRIKPSNQCKIILAKKKK